MTRRAKQATPGRRLKGQPKTEHDGEQWFPWTYAPWGAKGFKSSKSKANGVNGNKKHLSY